MFDEMTRDEMVQAGMMEADSYQDFRPANDEDPEAYAEMCREERIEAEAGLSIRRFS